jgi:exodeoxyribonuclease VII large subunit
MTSAATDLEVYTVSQLNRSVRFLLENHFPQVWVEGEVSNLSRPSSGHLYFSLKDAGAQLRCALFRNRARLCGARLANGLQVLTRARVSLYEPRGEYQLIVEHVEESGAGALRQAYDELRLRLEREGLFDPATKSAPPRIPRCIGVITSPTGAAVRDVLSVLRRRFPALPVLLYPVPVQGEGAGRDIARMIALAGKDRRCDVLLLVRGGGSLEDLWAFNEEVVARAIHQCPLPVVSGIGHETDVTIADFAADVRAPTPSAAAELVSPDRAESLTRIATLRDRLVAAEHRQSQHRHHTLATLETRLARLHPQRRLQDLSQRLDELEGRLRRAWRGRADRRNQQLAGLAARLRAQTPDRRIQHHRERLENLIRHLESVTRRRLERDGQRLAVVSRALHANSPLEILARGYGIVHDQHGAVIRRAEQVTEGDKIIARLHQGKLLCRVIEVNR